MTLSYKTKAQYAYKMRGWQPPEEHRWMTFSDATKEAADEEAYLHEDASPEAIAGAQRADVKELIGQYGTDVKGISEALWLHPSIVAKRLSEITGQEFTCEASKPTNTNVTRMQERHARLRALIELNGPMTKLQIARGLECKIQLVTCDIEKSKLLIPVGVQPSEHNASRMVYLYALRGEGTAPVEFTPAPKKERKKRPSVAIDRICAMMQDGQWRTTRELALATGLSQSQCSVIVNNSDAYERVTEIRCTNKVGRKTWKYRLKGAADEQPEQQPQPDAGRSTEPARQEATAQASATEGQAKTKRRSRRDAADPQTAKRKRVPRPVG